MSEPVTKMESKDRSSLERTMQAAINRILGRGSTGFIAPTVQTPTLTNSWANFGNGNDAHYWKDIHGVVHLEGTIKSGTIAAAAFTLPAGFRPLATKGYACDSNAAFGELVVNTTGTVVPNTGSNVYFILDGVTFRTV